MPHNKEGCCKSAAEEPEHVEGQASLIIDVEWQILPGNTAVGSTPNTGLYDILLILKVDV